MMDFELKLTKPSTKKAPIEGLVMGAAYFFGTPTRLITVIVSHR